MWRMLLLSSHITKIRTFSTNLQSLVSLSLRPLQNLGFPCVIFFKQHYIKVLGTARKCVLLLCL